MKIIFKQFPLIVILLAMLFSLNTFADTSAMLSQLQAMKIDKAQLKSALDMMKQSGKLTDAQAKQAYEKLEQMSDSDLDKLKNKAMGNIASGKVAPKVSVKKKPKQAEARAPASKPEANTSDGGFDLSNFQ